MKLDTTTARPTRPYRQSARAVAAEATATRILAAFMGYLRERWFDEITLEMLARDAQVTVQTIIRRYGSKEGLLEAACRVIDQQFAASEVRSPRDIDALVSAYIADYESAGPLVMRLLAQEDRYPAIRAVTDVGRASHRRRMKTLFAPWLAPLDRPSRAACLDALVVATDIYVWKLIRLDMKRPNTELHRHMRRMIASALALDPEAPLTFPHKEQES